MESIHLTKDEQVVLLKLARASIQAAVNHRDLPPINLSAATSSLSSHGASFVTLTQNGALRGCIGTLEAYQPLIADVQEHAVAAALHDYRFHPVTDPELPAIRIEISRLSAPVFYEYADPAELIQGLRPHIDGVVLEHGTRRATFLPQVWEQLPQVEEFLSHLCLKMGATSNLWKEKHLNVYRYQVEEFHE